jgi:hypothetical protein
VKLFDRILDVVAQVLFWLLVAAFALVSVLAGVEYWRTLQ